jgi:hypothetical protein
MTILKLTVAERRNRSAQRAESKARHMASIGMMKCDCTNVAVKMTSTGPACQRCLDLESHASNWIRKEASGVLRCGPDEFTCFGERTKKAAHTSNL